MAKTDLTSRRLREVLDYSPETGTFTRLVRASNRSASSSVGYDNGSGYTKIGIDGVEYFAHRLAWLWLHGTWPTDRIDHINGIRSDNRIINLRDVSQSVNGQNRKRHNSGNKSGFLGVSWHAGDKMWRARIMLHRKQYYLGNFHTPELAHAKYIEVKSRLHEGFSI